MYGGPMGDTILGRVTSMVDGKESGGLPSLLRKRDVLEAVLLGGVLVGIGILLADLLVFTAMEGAGPAAAYAAFIFSVGFVLGLEHATDADHVVAVSTIVSEHGTLRKSASVGITWGLGHTATLFFIGLVILIAKVSIPPRVALAMEFGVGILLVVLGYSVARSFIRAKLHRHGHGHEAGGEEHEHVHLHPGQEEHRHRHQVLNHKRKSFLVGMVHGVAGSAALAILVLATIDSILVGLAYILIFGVGSILGMLFISSLIGIPFTYTAKKLRTYNERIRVIAGLVSITLGVAIMMETALFGGLLG